MNPHGSLVGRLKLGLLALALVPLALGMILMLAEYVTRERLLVYQQYRDKADRVAQMLHAYLERAAYDVSLPQRFWDFDRLSPVEQERVLLDVMARGDMFSDIAYLGADGRERLHVARRTFLGIHDDCGFYAQDSVIRAIANVETSYGRISLDQASGEPFLQFATPVIDPRSGTLAGVLVSNLSLTPVWSKLSRMTQDTRDDAFITDDLGHIVAHRNPSVALGVHRYDPPGQTGLHRDRLGSLAVVSAAEVMLPGYRLTVVVSRPFRSAFGAGLAMSALRIGILALALSFAVFLFGWISRWLVRPVEALTRAAQQIAAGEAEARVSGSFSAEMAILANAFNVMVDRLREEHALLEQRVRVRTAELTVARDEAERASRAKSEFLSRMSHELRTPLNAILGFGQLLEAENLPPQQADSLHEILLAGRHLLELINEILDLARIESGHLDLAPEPVAVAELVRDGIALMKPLAAQRRIAMSTDISAGWSAHADRLRLRQV